MNILLSSVGRRTYLVKYFKEVIDGHVHVANSSDITPAFKEADASVITPDNTYIDFLIDYCRENEIKAIISLFDIDLPILAENEERFSAIGTQVIVSSSEVLNICNDKWHTYHSHSK